ncbi:MAG: hypothetical protein ACLS55_11915 [Lachnospiraceae bacterium]
MGKETYLAHTITQTDYEARYDRAAKKLLANKLVLAHILKDCVKEYQACSIMDIAQKYIEGEPEVGTTGVYMDDSNSHEQPDIKPETVVTQAAEVQAMNAQAMNTQVTKVQGMGNEDISQNEGTVYYDVRFNAIAPSTGEHDNIRLIINAEAQNRFKPKYPLTKRAVYYGSRLISAQHGTVFTKSDYQKLRKVYSIWICVNPAKRFRNTITRYSLKPETIIGNAVEAPENYDLINIVMVCLGKMEEWNDNNLIKFLGVLFQNELSAREKKDILERDFNIPMTEIFESEVDDMCNLSQGVAEEAMQKGLEQGRQEGIEQGRIELVNDGVLTIEKAAEKAGMSVEVFRNAMKKAYAQE